MLDLFIIRQRIKQLRRVRNLTADEMGVALGIDGRTYLAIESNRRRKMDLMQLNAICDVLGESLVDMIRAGCAGTEDGHEQMLESLLKVMEEYSAEKDRFICMQSVLIDHLLPKRGDIVSSATTGR